MATSKKIEVSGPKLPVSFEQFSKNPVAAVAFCMLLAVGYLYIDGKANYNKLIEDQGNKIASLEQRIIILTDQIRRSDSLLSAATSKIAVLEQLGKIPK
jgi:hypothetical protein